MPDSRTGTYTVASVPFWRRLGAAGTSSPTVIVVALVFGLRLVFGVAVVTMPALSRGESVGLAVAAYLVVAIIVMTVGTRRNPPPQLDFDRQEMRIGTDITPFSEITEAVLPVVPNGRSQDRTLYVLAPHHRQAAFVLSARRLSELNQADREIVADMLALSDIRLPKAKPDPYDPDGKFVWMDPSNNQTKEQAIALVLENAAKKS